ncbi:hypothetical protein ZWY2020_002905 [Hordeum vulgare]|nr:hypothetical protein ZWY2020_002905 [Hordeum vulgare]
MLPAVVSSSHSTVRTRVASCHHLTATDGAVDGGWCPTKTRKTSPPRLSLRPCVNRGARKEEARRATNLGGSASDPSGRFRPSLLGEEPRGFVRAGVGGRAGGGEVEGSSVLLSSSEKQIGPSASGDGFLRLRRAVGFSSGAKAGF